MSSLPADFIEKMKELLGDEFNAFMNSYDQPRTLGLRANTLKINIDDFIKLMPFDLERIPWTSEGFYYPSESQPGKHPYHEAGLYYIQEPSAMTPALLLNPQPGERILDLCAAPGGKSAQIGASMKGSGLLISNEIHPARAKVLSQNIERMGIKNCVVLNEDPARLAAFFKEFFHRILVDAPCSGEGMFRKNPEAQNQWSRDNVLLCARRQSEILDNAAKMLMPGGTLVYSTCTFSPEENEQVIENFLSQHPEFQIESPTIHWEGFDHGRPSWTLNGLQDISKTIRLWPHRVKGEGHYIAVLKKTGSLISLPSRSHPTEVNQGILSYYMDFAKQYLNSFPDKGFFLFGEHLYVIPQDMPSLKGLKVLRPGWHLGTFKKNRFEPSHAFALTLKACDVKQSLWLDSSSADMQSYLRGESLPCQHQNGWTLVLVDGYSIGWGKASGGILKNHYPKGLRWI
jgi:NOL1/NOP2/sun family putative RNA methylase